MGRVPGFRCAARRAAGGALRAYSGIDDFNKTKTEYSFPYNVSKAPSRDRPLERSPVERSPVELSEKVYDDIEKQSAADYNSLIEQDPRLDGLERGSPEYRDAVDEVHRDLQRHRIAQAKWYEFNERVRGVALGILMLLGIILAHQLFMNYDYLKAKVMYRFRFEGDVANMARDGTDPARNTHRVDNMVARLAGDITPAFVAAIKDSQAVPGLYVCGEANSQKIALRVPSFDGLCLKDVAVGPDYVAVVSDRGELYQYRPLLRTAPELLPLPHKLQKICVASDKVYGLTTKGAVVFVAKLGTGARVPCRSHGSLFWKKQYRYGTVTGLGERVGDMQHGASQLLMLGHSGKLYMCCTDQNDTNHGQYGLPQWSPFSAEPRRENVAIDMKLANYAVVGKPDGTKTVVPRTFTSIACGRYHNVAVDAGGNVWTWGLNNYGQCGLELGLTTDAQPVPQRAFEAHQLRRACGDADAYAANVHAANYSSYVECRGPGGHAYLLSFGNGVRGQLGASRYIHACPKPQLVNSLAGLAEYDERTRRTRPIGLHGVSVGSEHVLVTLDNNGSRKDVLAFGDNECGQLGNGKVTRSCKPVNLPELVEPWEVMDGNGERVEETEKANKSDETDKSEKTNKSDETDKSEKTNKSANTAITEKTRARRLARRLQDVVSHRLELLQNHRLADGKHASQVVVAGDNSSAIYYRK